MRDSARLLSSPSALIVAIAIGVSALAACSQGVPVPAPRAFNRPARIAFVCFAPGGEPTAIGACVLPDGTFAPDFRMLALVPQQTRGEVGAVELSSDPPRVLDSDDRVPGFTFVETGEVPAAIAVSETNPACTWVANRGSRDVWGIATTRFLQALTVGATPARVSLAGIDTGTGEPTSGRPQDLVLDDSGATPVLYVTLPEDGMIARIPVSNTGCALGTPVLFPVPSTVPEPPPEVAMIPEPTLDPLAEQDRATLAVCGEGALEVVSTVPEFVAVEPLPAEMPAPVPLEIVLERDPASGAPLRLLIGDGALPVIHRFDLVTGAFEEGMRTDGPIRDLTLTAPVPDEVGGSATRRYVYAIDDRDGSVMVIDASTGYVVPVQPIASGRPLRLPFQAPARAIEAIDTRTEGGICAGAPVPPTPVPGPDVLRGVFVSVALSDGTVRVIDVFDRDFGCRSGAGCETNFVGNEIAAFYRRHRPRVGRRIAENVALDELPSVVSAGATLRFTEAGAIEGESLIPSFVPATECPVGLAPVFVGEDGAFVCAITDPWSSQAESFSITWEGAIPQTSGTAGDLEPIDGGLVALDVRVDLCARGVLPMDLLAINPGTLPPELADSVRCLALEGAIAGAAPEPLLVAVESVSAGPMSDALPPFESRIVLRAGAPVLDRAIDGAPLTVEDVLLCYGDQLVSFELRAQDELVVLGSNSGFLHRVVPDPATGVCVVDESQSPLLDGRARLGERYESRRLAFELAYDTRPDVIPSIVIRFRVGNVISPLGVNLGTGGTMGTALTLPTELVWSETMNTLFALDELRRGLAPISVEPLRITRFIE
ncbi:MAG: hypothetical protein M3Y87_29265 [Myxococcota bacterium]|nr:hypothetical protein [Myxococcota bacterium]